MRVLLDDRPIEIEPVTVARAIEAARESANAEGRIVIEVLGDGRSVDQQLIESPPADTAGFAELKLVTADPGAFVAVTLSDSGSLLEAAADGHQRAADELMAGNREEAIAPLSEALQAWQVVRDVIEKSAALLGLDARAVACTWKSGSVTGGEIIDGLTEKLGEVKRTLTEQDDSALSDVLAYDMPEQVERWRALLKQLESIAAEGRA